MPILPVPPGASVSEYAHMLREKCTMFELVDLFCHYINNYGDDRHKYDRYRAIVNEMKRRAAEEDKEYVEFYKINWE